MMLYKLLWAATKLILGIVLGLAVLEVTLNLNPTLLLRGMALPAPVDAPLTVSEYDVKYSDADVFYWMPEQIQPIDPLADRVEAHVHFEVDEFGFPNASPLPANVDVVVVARSYGLGAQAQTPWPRLLAKDSGLIVLNLSQPASGIDVKTDFLRRFGLPRHPRWVVVEILPSMDILGYQAADPLVIQRLPFPVIQTLVRSFVRSNPISSYDTHPLYPLHVTVHARPVDLTFFPYDLISLSAEAQSISASNQWATFTRGLLALTQEAHDHSACVALLYAPTKPDIYLPLVDNITELQPAMAGLSTWRLDKHNNLMQDNIAPADLHAMQQNALDIRALLADFAQKNKLPFIDPSEKMTASILAGQDTFMRYDTHWSAVGHQIVAQQTADTLRTAQCQP